MWFTSRKWVRQLNWVLCVLGGFSQTALSQAPSSLSFKVALTQDSLSNTFTFPDGPSCTSINIYRKPVNSFYWTLKATLPAGTFFWTDSNLVAGAIWEYKFEATCPPNSPLQFLAVPNRLAPRHNQGVMMVVFGAMSEQDSQQLSPYYDRLIKDLTCDGWNVLIHYMSVGENDAALRSWVQDQMVQHPAPFHSLYLIGEVPVPYSGLIYPDGHLNHKGAWPADTYYSFSENVFSDSLISDASAGYVANHNLIGDAKWDQSFFPDTTQVFDIGVGRIAFDHLPAFGMSSAELTIRYLNRTHAYRRADFRLEPRAFISDGFGYFGGESFATAPIRNGQALYGVGQTTSLSNFPFDPNENCQFYFLCGSGTFSSCGGTLNVGMLVNQVSYAGFCSMFGSYFGDWYTNNNLLRATLAADGYTLTNCWNGRPLWTFHHMGAGYPVGYSAKWAMNNSITYPSNYGARFAHIGLMGDPGLRLHVVKPPSNLFVSSNDQGVELTWVASPEATHGYYIYRQNPATLAFEVLNTGDPVFSNFFVDAQPLAQNTAYMVRACKLEEHPSGSYYNLSLGVLEYGQGVVNQAAEVALSASLKVFPNPSNGSFSMKTEELPSGNYSLEVVGVKGDVYFSGTFSADQIHRGVAVSCKTAGVYVARIVNQNKGIVCSKRVVVLP